MISAVKDVEYFSMIVADRPGEARKLLDFLSAHMVNLLAITIFPVGGGESRIDFFPEDPDILRKVAADANVSLAGPRKAFLVQGDDKIGALYDLHLKLANAGINVHACNGVVDGTGRFGYVIWVENEDYEAAGEVLRSSDWRTLQPMRRT
jgi:hypothetical protein